MTLKTLENLDINELLRVFNLSFSDYYVPFHLTKEQLEAKIKSDRINLNLSAGAFENNMLTGFVLHGCDIIDNLKVAYNAGTGVIPAKRGRKLSKQLYQWLLPNLKFEEIDRIVLEVITENRPALVTYESIGFKIVRKLNCYKGSITVKNVPNELEIRELKDYDWSKLRSFWDWNPSWQNSIESVEILKSNNITIAIGKADKLFGYLIYNPSTKKVQQFSVDKHYRNRGIGKQCFNYISSNYEKEISLINIDDTSASTKKFIEVIGLKHFASQYEMELRL